MDDLTGAAGIAALAAGALALAALVACAVLAGRLRRLRQAYAAVSGGGERDLVEHAAELEDRLADLGRGLERTAARLDARDEELERGLARAVTHCAVVRYDAMGEMGGRQSSSVALLDSHRSGVVLSSILHREQARLYAKQVVSGRSEFELSPEEEQALATALDGRG